MKLPPPYEAALIRALHSTSGAAVRRAGAARLDDERLRQRIAEEFGISGGFGREGQNASYWGGPSHALKTNFAFFYTP